MSQLSSGEWSTTLIGGETYGVPPHATYAEAGETEPTLGNDRKILHLVSSCQQLSGVGEKGDSENRQSAAGS